MRENKLLGREYIKRPTCPFCGMMIEKPKELNLRRANEMPVGVCSCGAVYACDVTGHNLGSAQIEALVFGCNMDWDLAWNLAPGEDYTEEQIENYDYVNHLIVPGGVFEGRRISGALFFVRFHEDVLEVTADGVRKKLETAKPPVREKRKPGTGKSYTKKEVEDLVKSYKLDPLIEAAQTDRKMERNLMRLLYSADPEFRHRAAEALGCVSAKIAADNPSSISKLLQRLFTSISDTAASSWGAFEAIGEIIRHKLDLFAGYIPELYQFLGDETRRAITLRTLGSIAGEKPDLLRKHTLHFIPYLKDQDPAVRGYAAHLLGNLGATEIKKDLEQLREETVRIELYENGILEKKTVGQIAAEAHARL
ncbi:MAG TPA: PBS lyase [Desulfobacteraceae bacterium]|nr:MAG: PBS lyase [Deltaproteobacteria bacterium]HDZ24184.1 PBS lyase [Desulfobacteraceae bacterium]